MTEADPGPRVSAEAAWEDFRGAGAALREVNKCGRVGFRPGASYMRMADSESFKNSSSSLGASPAGALPNLPTLHMHTCNAWNTFVCHFLQEDVFGLPPLPPPALSSSLVFPGHLHYLLVQVTSRSS